MKKLLLILFISTLAFTIHATTSDSLTLVQLKQQVQAQDSTIKAMQVKLNEVQIQKDFFSNEITIMTAIFTVIVGLFSIALVYLIPQNLKKDFKKKFSEMKNKFASLEKDSIKRKNEFEIFSHRANGNFLALIAKLNLDSKHYYEALLYYLEFLYTVAVFEKDRFSVENYKEYFNYFFLNVNDAILNLKVKNKDKDSIKEDLETINRHLDKLISITSNTLKNKLIKTKEMINIETWKIISNQ